MADETKKSYNEYVDEAYELFIKNAEDMEPTDGVKAIKKYFEKSALDELKAKVKAEGKTADDAWRFVVDIARKHRLEHIDPVAVYAIAMHYFEDVPKDAKQASTAAPKPKQAKTRRSPRKGSTAATEDKDANAAPKAPKPSKKPKKPASRQGFFFDLLDKPEQKEPAQGGAENADQG